MNGARRYAMRVWLSRENLAARQLTVADVENSLLRENVELPAGRLESREREFTLRTDTNLRTEEDFRNLVVGRGPDGYLVRLGEVAEVRLASDDDRSLSRSNGAIGLSMAIIPQSKANVLATSGAVKKRLAEIQSTLPKDITRRGQHRQRRVHRGIAEKRGVRADRDAGPRAHRHLPVPRHAARHADPRGHHSRCPSSPRPSSWLALDYSINTLTLLGAVLAIGLVVDDAIVVLENIVRRIEGGEPPVLASINGSQRDRLRRDRDHAGADGGVRARVLHDRRYRAGCSASSASRSPRPSVSPRSWR